MRRLGTTRLYSEAHHGAAGKYRRARSLRSRWSFLLRQLLALRGASPQSRKTLPGSARGTNVVRRD